MTNRKAKDKGISKPCIEKSSLGLRMLEREREREKRILVARFIYVMIRSLINPKELI